MIAFILFCVTILVLVSLVWVNGIDFMKDNHPDYKGDDLFDSY